MSDREYTKCKACNEVKERVSVTTWKSGESRYKKFTDDEGSVWNGRVCPQCNIKRISNDRRMRAIENQIKKELSDGNKVSSEISQ